MTEEEEIIIVPGRWDLPFRHTAGRIASHFFHGLKEKRILATPCPRCERVLMPPRPFCERCFVPPRSRRLQGDAKVLAKRALPHKILQTLGPEGCVDSGLLGKEHGIGDAFGTHILSWGKGG